MHDLVTAASRALAQQDAAELDRLLEEVRTRMQIPVGVNMGDLAHASHVLAEQVRAAERHLGLRGGSSPWEL